MRLKTAEMLGGIDLKRATCERAMCVAVALAPLEYGTQARGQLAGREGLCDVVISANLETDDLVDFVVAKILDQLRIENILQPRWGE